MTVKKKSKKNLVTGLLLMMTGGFSAAIPRQLFPTCGFSSLVEPVKGAMMRCNGTGSVTIFLGLLTVCLALLLLSVENPSVRRWLLFASAVAGAALFPLFLFWPGVCNSASMPCRVGTLPAALLVGGIQLFVAVVSLLREQRR